MKDAFIISKKTGNLVYTSTESVLDEHEKALLYLVQGGAPKNEQDVLLQNEIAALEEDGKIVEIPPM